MSKKASISIEAALIMPLVFYALLAVLGFIQYQHFDYKLNCAGIYAAEQFSYDSYVLYHLEVSDLMAHSVYKKWDAETEPYGEVFFEPKISFESMESGGEYHERLEELKSLWESFKDLQTEWPKTAKQEGAVLLSRAFLNHYLKSKIIDYFQDYPYFDRSRLRILYGHYLFDFKGSYFCVNYRFAFPLKLPFLKEVNLLVPIYVESFIGNIIRYQGQPYEEENSEEPPEMVYYTEKGKCYHTNAKCISIYAEAKTYAKSELKGGKPCELCQKKAKVFGNQVFKTKSSKIYHADKDCMAIHHQVRSISLPEAIDKGLLDCKHCQKARVKEEGRR